MLTGLDAKLYLACDSAQTSASAARKLGDATNELEVCEMLRSLRDARLMVEMDGRYLSLAVLRNRATQEPSVNRSLRQETQKPEALLKVI